MTVAVTILAVSAKRRRHELTEPHGAGERTGDGDRRNLLLPAEIEEIGKFRAVVLGSPRVVKGERHQGVEHAEAPHIAAIYRFHSDDGGHGITADAGLLFNARKDFLVVAQKGGAALNAFGIDDIAFVKQKVLFRRRLLVCIGTRRRVALGQRRIARERHFIHQPFEGNALFIRNVLEVFLHIGAFHIVACCGTALYGLGCGFCRHARRGRFRRFSGLRSRRCCRRGCRKSGRRFLRRGSGRRCSCVSRLRSGWS